MRFASRAASGADRDGRRGADRTGAQRTPWCAESIGHLNDEQDSRPTSLDTKGCRLSQGLRSLMQ